MKMLVGVFGAALGASGGCHDTHGAFVVGIVTSPRTTLDGIATLRITLPLHHQTYEISPDELDLVLDESLRTDGEQVRVDAVDENGATIMIGQSPPFGWEMPDRVVVFLAPPMSITRAPMNLVVARDPGLGVTPSSVLALGGRDFDANAANILERYDLYDHTIGQLGDEVIDPAVSDKPVFAVNGHGDAYIVGNAGLWYYDAPTRRASLIGTGPTHLQPIDAVQIGEDDFFVTMYQDALEIRASTVYERGDIHLGGVNVTPDGWTGVFLCAGVTQDLCWVRDGVVEYQSSSIGYFEIIAQTGFVANRADGSLLVSGWNPETGRLMRLDPRDHTVTAVPTSHFIDGASIAVTSQHVAVVGGNDEHLNSLRTAEILEADGYATVASLPITHRDRPRALVLPNDEIMIIGGLLGSGMPTAEIEIFTPGSFESPVR